MTDHFNINENTLQAIVQKLTGKSFFEYIEYQRMKKAEQLIRYTSIPISDIFIQCGYSTHNSFYKAFKRYHGISPSAMRVEIQSNTAALK